VVTLAVCFALLAGGLVAVLSQSAVRETGSNRVRAMAQLEATQPGQALCQRGELVPGGTGAIRASLLPTAEQGGTARIAVIGADGATVARSPRPVPVSGLTLTVPLRPIVARDTAARVCIASAGTGLAGLGEAAADGGGRASAGGQTLGGDLRLVYLRPQAESWWASAGRVTDRMGAGHVLGGPALALLAALLMVASAALAAWQLAKGAA
jgi:hypothetical protein